MDSEFWCRSRLGRIIYLEPHGSMLHSSENNANEQPKQQITIRMLFIVRLFQRGERARH